MERYEGIVMNLSVKVLCCVCMIALTAPAQACCSHVIWMQQHLELLKAFARTPEDHAAIERKRREIQKHRQAWKQSRQTIPFPNAWGN